MSLSDTSAIPVGLRSRVPAKITSSMREPRKVLADCSPRTQEIASAMLDLPQPLGPMMAAIPSPWNFSSVRSQKDLKPRICSFFSLSNFHSFGTRSCEQSGAPHCMRRLTRAALWFAAVSLPRGRYHFDACSRSLRTQICLHPNQGTDCSYCTDEIGAGSINNTQHVVVISCSPREVSHTM